MTSVLRALTVLAAATLVASPVVAQKKTKTAKAKDAAASDWSGVERALGRHAAAQVGSVARFSFPRRDLTPMLQGVQIRPALALGSWVAFSNAGARSMVMGDLVLAEDEVAGVIDKLIKGGVEISALHNHLMLEVPPVMYMHIAAHGNAVSIASTIRAALQTTRTPMDTAGTGAPVGLIDLDTAAIASVLGVRGTANGGVYQISIPREGAVKHGGAVVPAGMGIATVMNFQATGASRSAVTGDFVLTADEVQDVIAALRRSAIEVTAVHNHMMDESPRLYFVHFWAHDDTRKLATGLKQALDAGSSRKRR